ncbi:hypothetical protein AAKU52_000467 [Pedobacter sp. CG_S7]|uniref:nucleotide-diphospho-sugar transferase n=1 Tax=Pedobacter sp. CG_S7 TaxID=3143930 RepID=UPI0033919AAE
MKNYQAKSPLLFLIFNRPDTTLQVFNQIKVVKPPKLYIAADGPRSDKTEEQALCEKTRSIINDIDWDCEVKTLFRKNNLGCKEAISTAIDWFFEVEQEGVILEDDCLPSIDFFRYCDVLLEKYRFDTRIRHISGCNLQLGKQWGNASYYFTNQSHVWGWATWKRVWKDYDKTLSEFSQEEANACLDNIFDDTFLAEEWQRIFKETKAGIIDTWDYQLTLINYFNNSLSINPNVNLISNIGFRADGTHTTNKNSPYANLALENLGELRHPKFFVPEKTADYAVFKHEFSLAEKWRKQNLLRRRIKRFISSFFKN